MIKYARCFYDTLEPTPEPYPEEIEITERVRGVRVRTIQENRRLYTKAELRKMPRDQFKALGPLTVVMQVEPIRQELYVSNGDKRIPEGLEIGNAQYICLAYEIFDE